MKRTAIITGATRGIGKATAIRLAKKGFSLVLVYRKEDEFAQALTQELSQYAQVISIRADVARPQECQRVFDEAKQAFGFVDTLVNNAGISHVSFFDTETQSSYDEVMDVNFRSAFTLSNLVCKDMIANKFGRIVNVSSVWGQRGGATEVLYSASKAALIGFTKALNAELAPSGILVNAACPGVIDTDMNACFADQRAELEEQIPLGRYGTPDEVASMIEYLTQEELYVGGAEITVSAGF